MLHINYKESGYNTCEVVKNGADYCVLKVPNTNGSIDDSVLIMYRYGEMIDAMFEVDNQSTYRGDMDSWYKSAMKEIHNQLKIAEQAVIYAKHRNAEQKLRWERIGNA